MRRLLPIRCSELHGPRAGRTGQEARAPGLRRRRCSRLSFWRLESDCAPPPAGAGFARTAGRSQALGARLSGRGGGGAYERASGGACAVGVGGGGEAAGSRDPASAAGGGVSAPASLPFRFSVHLLSSCGWWGGRPPRGKT